MHDIQSSRFSDLNCDTSPMRIRLSITMLLIFATTHANASRLNDLQHLQKAYPEQIKAVSTKEIIWQDGTHMPVVDDQPNKTNIEKLNSPSLVDQLQNAKHYPRGKKTQAMLGSHDDPGRIRYQPFFEKMYGSTEAEVKKHLVVVYWLPKRYGKKYPMLVTSVNGVAKKLIRVSNELEQLPSTYNKYLSHAAGTYERRMIANTDRLSPHSYGIAIDISDEQSPYSNYWLWDLERAKKSTQDDSHLVYQNKLPWKIIQLFEANGFIWGGKWYHYDTMHFEYRPDLMSSM